MKFKTFVFCFTVGLIVAALLITPRLRKTWFVSKAYASSSTAFTLNQHYRTVGPKGDRVIQQITVARKADGSRVSKIYTTYNGWRERQVGLSNGVTLQIYDDVKTVSSIQEDKQGGSYLHNIGLFRDSNSDCLRPLTGTFSGSADVLVGKELVGGVLSDKVAVGGSQDFQVWYAPALGCEPIQHMRRFGDSTSYLVFDSILLTEPDPNLFVVTPDYQELPPSQAGALHFQFGNVPGPHLSSLIQSLARKDAYYATHRP